MFSTLHPPGINAHIIFIQMIGFHHINVLMFDCLGYEVVLSRKVPSACIDGEVGSDKCTSLSWSLVIGMVRVKQTLLLCKTIDLCPSFLWPEIQNDVVYNRIIKIVEANT